MGTQSKIIKTGIVGAGIYYGVQTGNYASEHEFLRDGGYKEKVDLTTYQIGFVAAGGLLSLGLISCYRPEKSERKISRGEDGSDTKTSVRERNNNLTIDLTNDEDIELESERERGSDSRDHLGVYGGWR